MKKILRFSIIVILTSLFTIPAAAAADKIYKKVISLSPGVTEIIYSISAEDLLAGNTTACGFPEEAKSVYKIGAYLNPDLEKLASLDPDLIIAEEDMNIQKLAKLKKMGYNLYVSKNSRLNDITRSIAEIGNMLGKQKEAKEELAKWETARKKAGITSKGRKLKVLVLIWHDPLYVPGKNTFINDMLEICNCVNITADAASGYYNVSAEKIIMEDPDIIITAFHDKAGGKEVITGKKEFACLTAVKKGRIYDGINPDILLRSGPRLKEGIGAILKIVNQVREDIK